MKQEIEHHENKLSNRLYKRFNSFLTTSASTTLKSSIIANDTKIIGTLGGIIPNKSTKSYFSIFGTPISTLQSDQNNLDVSCDKLIENEKNVEFLHNSSHTDKEFKNQLTGYLLPLFYVQYNFHCFL